MAQINSDTLTAKLSKKDNNLLEQGLSAFARRFPVSGRIVHALAQEFGGVIGLAKHIEKKGKSEEANSWFGESRPSPLSPEEVRGLFETETLDSVAQHLAIPRESVEIQAALGIPKFFGAIGHEEDDVDIGYGSPKKKKSGKASKTLH